MFPNGELRPREPKLWDLQGTSVYRDLYLNFPEDAFRFVKGDLRGLAYTTPKSLPQSIPHRQTKKFWEWFEFDDPFIDDDGIYHIAHAEIRCRRHSDRPNPDNVKPSKAMKDEMRERLARSFTVSVSPL